MDNTIISEKAFKQLLNYMPLYPIIMKYKICDGDIICKLMNGISVIIEVKKDTDNHTVKDVINSNQWDTIKSAAKESTYLIYASHNEEISDKMIDCGNLIVRYVEVYDQSQDFKPGITLLKYLNGLSSIGMYYIKVQYPNGNKEIALISPEEGEKWTTTEYWAGKCAFKTKEDCKEYIKKRYEKEFNRSYIYSVWYVESMSSVKLVHEYTYPETIGL